MSVLAVHSHLFHPVQLPLHLVLPWVPLSGSFLCKLRYKPKEWLGRKHKWLFLFLKSWIAAAIWTICKAGIRFLKIDTTWQKFRNYFRRSGQVDFLISQVVQVHFLVTSPLTWYTSCPSVVTYFQARLLIPQSYLSLILYSSLSLSHHSHHQIYYYGNKQGL